jgi:hypothetical protein
LVGVQAGDFVGNDLEGMADERDCQVSRQSCGSISELVQSISRNGNLQRLKVFYRMYIFMRGDLSTKK